ncbi:hypothetical protein Lepto7375DRAFT_6253 [Leptolyngbya sp. PCC 7375]|nr:hypothetical protein Lepto7375DRAFT_6253 [Leptolyngbya sp. PCC 7375]
MIFLEFSGTPGSGKNSVIKDISSQTGVACKIVQANEKIFDISNSNFELKNLWTIFDTYSKLEIAVKQKDFDSYKAIIFNRGMFDRIAWVRLLKMKNSSFSEIADYLEAWLRNNLYDLSKDEPYKIVLFLTSYEKIIVRRPDYLHDKSQIPWIINHKTINDLNSIYYQLYGELKKNLDIILIDDLESDLSLQDKISVVMPHLLIA